MSAAALHAHLGTGLTTVCRCWLVRRRDGTEMGFTDHDLALDFEGIGVENTRSGTSGALDAERFGRPPSSRILAKGIGSASEGHGGLGRDIDGDGSENIECPHS